MVPLPGSGAATACSPEGRSITALATPAEAAVNASGHLILFIHARMGPETLLSGVSIEKTKDTWLSPFASSSVGQWVGPSLQSSSCSIRLNGITPPSTVGSAPMSRSPLASMIFTEVLFNSGRLDRASCVAASTGGPNPPGPPGRGGPPGCPAARPGSAPSVANAPFDPQVLPASARTDMGLDPPTGGGFRGAISNGAGDMKITPFTPTPFGP